jgi:WD40 repeat protein
VLSVAFSPDGRKIATASLRPGVKLWEVGTGKLLGTLEGSLHQPSRDLPNFSIAVAFSPDGRRIAAGNAYRMVEVWDVETAKLVQTLEGHASLVAATSFSPDGRQIVSAGNFDKTIRLWSTANGRLLSTLLSLGADDYVAIGEDGFFAASPGAFAHLSLVRGLEAIEVPDEYKTMFMRARTLDEIAAAMR